MAYVAAWVYVDDEEAESATDDQIRNAARAWYVREGEVEIDNEAEVLR